MSTILKALKKAEQASWGRHTRIDDSAGFRFRTRAKGLSDRKGQSRALVWLGIATGVVLVLAVIYFFQSGDTLTLPGETPVKATLTAGDPPAAQRKPEPAGPESGMASNAGPKPAPLQTLPDKPVSAPLPEQPQNQGLTASNKPPQAPVLSYQPFDPKTMSAPVRMVPDKPVAGPVPQKPVARFQPLEDAQESGPEAFVRMEEAIAPDHQGALPGQAQNPPPAFYIQTLESDTLKLQAISWSQTPSERIAVISNRVLGEKESIEGYSILKINEDEIILQDSDGQKARLAFKSR